MKSFKDHLFEQVTGCPIATHNLLVNLQNRQTAIDEYGYGPLNPMEPSEDFWKQKAMMWKVSPEYAKTARCENCAAFNISDRMRECIVSGTSHNLEDPDEIDGFENTVEQADLGYCNILHFKCAGKRTCDAWLTNGPLEKENG